MPGTSGESFDFLIDKICDEFEEQWQRGEVPRISEKLPLIDSRHQKALLTELIMLDHEIRSRHNLPCDIEYYCSALPEFRDFITAEIRFSVDEATTRQPEQDLVRTAILETGNTSRQIGPYRLLQQIGEGGMGTVWMAEQEQPVRRRVALKLVKSNLTSKEVIARFEAERQALAMMNHQNIAKVLDAGTTDQGDPYFVMELVKGIPITRFCDDNKLSIVERLKLFIPVCKAVQHAHQKGIIHRDLKPSNVLVTLYDGDAVPKVIDFGLAKALEHTTKLTDKTMFTEFGKVVGTLQYMSPEQAEMNALDVDTRTDVYSLGVMLYELLTGSTPLDKKTLGKKALLQVLEIIRETEPQKPSTRLSTSGDTVTGISEQRKIAPARLQQILRGELDWVVMKALEKDRRRRYETAAAFADDINRYLDDEAVLALPPSARYKIGKFIRKNRGLFVATSALIALLVAGIAGTSYGLYRAEAARADALDQKRIAEQKTEEASRKTREAIREKSRADLEADSARTAEADAKAAARRSADALKLFTDAFGSGDNGKASSPQSILDRAFASIESSNLDDLTKAELLTAISSSYLRLSRREEAKNAARESLVIRRSELGRKHPDTLKSMLVLAEAHSIHSSEYIQLLESAMELAADADDNFVFTLMEKLAEAYLQQRELQDGIRMYEQLVEIKQNKLGSEVESTLKSMSDLAHAYVSVKRYGDAVKIYEKAIGIRQKEFDPNNESTLAMMSDLASLYRQTGNHTKSVYQFKQIRQYFLKQHGSEDYRTLRAGTELAGALLFAGNLQESLEIYETTVASMEEQKPLDKSTLDAMAGLAAARQATGKIAESIDVLERLRSLVSTSRNRTQRGSVPDFVLNDLQYAYEFEGRSRIEMSNADMAFANWRHSRDLSRLGDSRDGNDDTLILESVNRGLRLDDLHRGGSASSRSSEIIDSFDGRREYDRLCDNFDADHPLRLAATSIFATACRMEGYLERAIELYDRLLPELQKQLGRDHPKSIHCMLGLAKSHFFQRNNDKAISQYELVLSLCKQKLGTSHPTTVEVVRDLAHAYFIDGQVKKARQLHEQQLDASSLKLSRPLDMQTLIDYSRILLADSDFQKAEQFSRKAYEYLLENGGTSSSRSSGWKLLQRYDAQSILGAALHAQGELPEAGRFLNEAYSGLKEVTKSANSISPLIRFRRISEAHGRLAKQVNEGDDDELKAKLSFEYDTVISAMTSLASWYKRKTSYEQQKTNANRNVLLKHALEISSKNLGTEHATTLKMMTYLARDHDRNNRSIEAQKIRSQIVAIREARLQQLKEQKGPEHKDTLLAMKELADEYRFANRREEAQDVRGQMLSIRLSKLSDADFEDEKSIESIKALAKDFRSSGDAGQAMQLYEKVLRSAAKRQTDKKYEFVKSLNLLLNSISLNDNEAIRLYEINLSLQEDRLGAKDFRLLPTLIRLLQLHQRAGDRHSGEGTKQEKSIELLNQLLNLSIPQTRSEWERRFDEKMNLDVGGLSNLAVDYSRSTAGDHSHNHILDAMRIAEKISQINSSIEKSGLNDRSRFLGGRFEESSILRHVFSSVKGQLNLAEGQVGNSQALLEAMASYSGNDQSFVHDSKRLLCVVLIVKRQWAQALEHTKDLVKAVERKGLTIEDLHAWANTSQAVCLLNLGRFKEAAAKANRTLASSKASRFERYRAESVLAVCEAHDKQFEPAIQKAETTYHQFQSLLDAMPSELRWYVPRVAERVATVYRLAQKSEGVEKWVKVHLEALEQLHQLGAPRMDSRQGDRFVDILWARLDSDGYTDLSTVDEFELSKLRFISKRFPTGKNLLTLLLVENLLQDESAEETKNEFRNSKAPENWGRLDRTLKTCEQNESWVLATYYATWLMKFDPNYAQHYERLHNAYRKLSEKYPDELLLDSILHPETNDALKLPKGTRNETTSEFCTKIRKKLSRRKQPDPDQADDEQREVTDTEISELRDVADRIQDVYIFDTLAIAEFHLGNWQSAIDAGLNSIRLSSKTDATSQYSNPINLAILAMSYRKLANNEKAMEFRQQLNSVMNQERYQEIREYKSYFQEAEQVFQN